MTILCIALAVLSLLFWAKSCQRQIPNQTHTESVKIDTVVVSKVLTKTVYRDRIKATIDSIKTDSYVASMDTLIIMPKATVKTAIVFRHPEQTFSFAQDIKVKVDTVYVNKTRLIETTKIKTNWTNTFIGTVAGFCGGVLTGLLAQ